VDRLVSFSGLDGAGKTAHALALVNSLEETGILCAYYWGGSRPVLFSYPILALGRLVGFTKRIKFGQKTFYLRQFNKNRCLAVAWNFSLFLDYAISLLVKIRIALALGRIVVCDRYVYDLVAESLESGLYSSIFARMILHASPEPCLACLINADETTTLNRLFAEERKQEQPFYDIGRKRAIYLRLSKEFNLSVIDSSKEFAANHQIILQEVFQKLKLPRSERDVALSRIIRQIDDKIRDKRRSKRGSPSKFFLKVLNRMLFRTSPEYWRDGTDNSPFKLGTDSYGRSVAQGIFHYYRLLKKRGLDIRALIILGSRAKGRWNPGSDVDVLVIANNMPTGIRKKLALFDTMTFMGIESNGCTENEFLSRLEQLDLKALDAFYYGKVIYDDGFWQIVKNRFVEIERRFELKKTGKERHSTKASLQHTEL